MREKFGGGKQRQSLPTGKARRMPWPALACASRRTMVAEGGVSRSGDYAWDVPDLCLGEPLCKTAGGVGLEFHRP